MATYREERIRQLAHEIWEREGHPHGRDAEHWRMATEAYEAEMTRSRVETEGQPMTVDEALETETETEETREWVLRTPAVATTRGTVANQPSTALPATPRKRRTKAEIDTARAAEAPAPKRKRRTKAEMAAAAAGLAGAAAAVAATVAVTKRRRGAKAETADEPAPTAAPAPAADVALKRPRRTRGAAVLSEADPMAVAATTGAVLDPSADGPADAASAVRPDPDAAPPSDTALETFSEPAPSAELPGERTAD